MSTRHPPAALVSEQAVEARRLAIATLFVMACLHGTSEPYLLGHAVTDAVAANA